MSNSTLPNTALYDPKQRIKNFRFEQDFENIRLNFLGTGELFQDDTFWYYLESHLGDEREWRRPKQICDHPFFIKGKPKRFDALQSDLGNCWLLNAIEAITCNDILIKHVVPPDQSFDNNYIGAFHFRIWQLGMWYDVVVDDRLPYSLFDNALVYARSSSGDVFWAALLEKAYAKVCKINTTFNIYGTLEAGYCLTGMQDLSGGIVERVATRHIPDGLNIKFFLSKLFNQALMNVMCVKEGEGMELDHGYTVTGIFKTEDNDPDYHGLFLVRVMNPWGTGEWIGRWSDEDFDNWKQIDRNIRKKINFKIEDDGEFWMDEDNFVEYFDEICISHLGPGRYLESRNTTDYRNWRTTSFNGEWIKDISAGGKDLSTRHKNPQYIMDFEYPDTYSDRYGWTYVVIELTQRSKLGRDVTPLIAFYIYALAGVRNAPTPLDQNFFQKNDPLDKDPDFDRSDGRAYLMGFKLNLGKYVIVPCTEKENEETLFLLRVFSESPVQLWEYDTTSIKIWEDDDKIEKSFTMEEKRSVKPDKGLKALFYDVAQGGDEIDWVKLKEMLDDLMNPRRSFVSMVSSFFKSIFDAFGKLISPRSSHDYECDDIAFTKDECRSMIAMLDENHSGKLSFPEFSRLWNKIVFWAEVYKQYTDENERHLRISKLREALRTIGYDVSKRSAHSLSYVYAREQGNVHLTDFILCGITLETVLTVCKREVEKVEKKFTCTLEQWIRTCLFL